MTPLHVCITASNCGCSCRLVALPSSCDGIIGGWGCSSSSYLRGDECHHWIALTTGLAPIRVLDLLLLGNQRAVSVIEWRVWWRYPRWLKSSKITTRKILPIRCKDRPPTTLSLSFSFSCPHSLDATYSRCYLRIGGIRKIRLRGEAIEVDSRYSYLKWNCNAEGLRETYQITIFPWRGSGW